MNSMREAHWMTWVQILINRKDYDLGNRVDMAQKPEDLPPLRTYKDGPSMINSQAAPLLAHEAEMASLLP